jgi:hypothetical protein
LTRFVGVVDVVGSLLVALGVGVLVGVLVGDAAA